MEVDEVGMWTHTEDTVKFVRGVGAIGHAVASLRRLKARATSVRSTPELTGRRARGQKLAYVHNKHNKHESKRRGEQHAINSE